MRDVPERRAACLTSTEFLSLCIVGGVCSTTETQRLQQECAIIVKQQEESKVEALQVRL